MAIVETKQENTSPRTDGSKETKAVTTDTERVDVAKKLFDECAEETPCSPFKTVLAIPEESSQKTNDAWIKENGAADLIKMRGQDRTVEVVRGEMKLYKMGADSAAAKFDFLKQPDATKEAQDDWVQTHLAAVPERVKKLPLSGEGRTKDVIGSDIRMTILGALAVIAGHEVAPLPEEVTQKDNDAWANENVKPEGTIKLRGTGRTADAVRAEMGCFKMGAILMSDFLTQPEATRDAQNDWVQLHLADVEDRAKLLPLSGEGRTSEAIGGDIEIVIAGAKWVLGGGDEAA